jgi:hypothetical protein
MMGERRVRQEALVYEFSLERHVPKKVVREEPAEPLSRAAERRA